MQPFLVTKLSSFSSNKNHIKFVYLGESCLCIKTFLFTTMEWFDTQESFVFSSSLVLSNFLWVIQLSYWFWCYFEG
jgi:hypothetical protein